MQHRVYTDTARFKSNTLFGNLPDKIATQPPLFRRGNSYFVKLEGRKARCVRPAEDGDTKGEIVEFGDSVPVELITLEECGCCGAYHPDNYGAECRDDHHSFPSWQTDELLEDYD
jgi:hypothetical protein